MSSAEAGIDGNYKSVRQNWPLLNTSNSHESSDTLLPSDADNIKTFKSNSKGESDYLERHYI